MSDFPKKWAKIINELKEFKEMAEAASPEELKKLIVRSTNNIFVVEKELEANDSIKAKKEDLKNEMAPYRDAMKEQTARIKYCLYLLDESGEDMGEGKKDD